MTERVGLAIPGSSSKLSIAMSQIPSQEGKKEGGIPEGLWMRCPECGEMLFRKVVEEGLHVCPNCQYHFRISARERCHRSPGR